MEMMRGMLTLMFRMNRNKPKNVYLCTVYDYVLKYNALLAKLMGDSLEILRKMRK
jgi:hypothetical protein